MKIKKTLAAIAALSIIGSTAALTPVVSAESAGSAKAITAQNINDRSGRLEIREAGTYIIKGKLKGTLYINVKKGDVNLILNNAEIDGGEEPAIVQLGGDLEISGKSGTKNVIKSSGTAVKSGGTVKFSGGRVSVMSNGSAFDAKELVIGAASVSVTAKQLATVKTKVTDKDGNLVFNELASDAAATASDTGAAYSGSTDNSAAASVQKQPAVQQDGNVNVIDVQELPAIPQNGSIADGQQPPELPQNGNIADGQQPPELPQNGNIADGQGMPGMPQNQTNAESTVENPTEIAEGITENSAMTLTADTENAVTYDVSENSEVKITSSGTYIVTGESSDGSITVKKGTTGVVLILDDLDLTSTSGAALSINKNAEVQVIISGTVTLTDNENPDDENSADEAVADAYDGAAIKIKADSVAFFTGDGTLNINGNAKNGIKAGDNSSVIIGGDININITAVNDGINSNYDFTILSGDIDISAGDDAIHADHILTVGSDGEGPDITITSCEEGLEGTVVNIVGGNINVTSSDDAVNAANSDGTYADELEFSINVTGGNITVKAGGDGLDSNGNINLIAGRATINSASNGGEAGIDYDGDFYISDNFVLNNNSGVAGPDMMPGGMQGGMPGDMGQGQPGGMQGGMPGGQPGDMGGGMFR